MMRVLKNSVVVLLLASYGFVGGAGIVSAWNKILNSGGEPHAVASAKTSRPLTSLPVYVQASQSPTTSKHDSIHNAIVTEYTPVSFLDGVPCVVLTSVPNVSAPFLHYFSPRSPPRS
jgi:hypothetical protein